MKQQSATATVPEDPCAAAIFHAVFRLTSVVDLYGPERAIEWAQSLLDDPELLEAFACPKTRRLQRLSPPPGPRRDPGGPGDSAHGAAT